MTPPKQPTPKQCNDNYRFEHEGQEAFACWYPQMGGYTGRAVVVLSKAPGGCFEAWIWHDGQFPFDDSGDGAPSPALIHHCMAEQFIRFGELVIARGRAT